MSCAWGKSVDADCSFQFLANNRHRALQLSLAFIHSVARAEAHYNGHTHCTGFTKGLPFSTTKTAITFTGVPPAAPSLCTAPSGN